ncbi:MAG: EamA family transporter [bacterium]|nr:EamA family transporter [bacterium]
MSWILLSLNAALFYALRFVLVKKYLSGVNTYLLAFTARLFSFLFLLPMVFFFEVRAVDSLLFWQMILVTSLFTALASIMQLTAIKKYDLSSSVPFLSFVPLFMMGSVFLIFEEMPRSDTLWGILLLTVGAYILNLTRKATFLTPIPELFKNRGGLLFLGVAFIYGFTTTLDRVAIDTAGSGGFTYSLFWNLFSVFIFAPIFLNRKQRPVYAKQLKQKFGFLALQGFCTMAAFYSQMMAVEFAKDVMANVVYVKALTLLQLFIGVILGIVIFKEENAFFRVIGALFMLIGAVLLIILV